MAPRSPRSRGLVEFDSNTTLKGIKISARNAKGQYTRLQGVVLRANERALRFLQDEAKKNLEKSIAATGNPQERNSGRLMRAIEDPASHTASKEGFSFMRDDKVRKDVPYYRAIERGSDYWVGKRLPFIFLGGVGPEGGGRVHLVGPREQQRTGLRTGAKLTRIGRPVPTYGYASKARRTMLSQRIYQTYLVEEATKAGANLTVT